MKANLYYTMIEGFDGWDTAEINQISFDEDLHIEAGSTMKLIWERMKRQNPPENVAKIEIKNKEGVLVKSIPVVLNCN